MTVKEPIEVLVPVPKICAIPRFYDQILPIDQPLADDIVITSRALITSIELLEGRNELLRQALRACGDDQEGAN